MKRQEDGFALVWVMVLGMILLIFVFSALAASSAIYRRGMDVYREKQVDLMASSILDITVDSLKNNDSENFIRAAVLECLDEYLHLEEEDINIDASSKADEGFEADGYMNEFLNFNENGSTDVTMITDRNLETNITIHSDAPHIELPQLSFYLDDFIGACTIDFIYYYEDQILYMRAAAELGAQKESISAFLKADKRDGAVKFTLLKYGDGNERTQNDESQP